MTSSRHAVRVQEALYWYWICERVFWAVSKVKRNTGLNEQKYQVERQV